LRENLKASDIEASDIVAILMTHMYPDHEAGFTDADGSPVFKGAELVVHENEVAFWRDDGAMGRASSEGRGDFLLARAALDAYSDRIRTVKATTPPRAGHRCHDQPDDLWPAIAIPERVGHAQAYDGQKRRARLV
jgi:glyoxylase-like metal-dependent hydrolase (beta-lactamase superfamily II)